MGFQEKYLAALPLTLYHLGTYHDLRRPADGSLTLYVQHDTPGQAKTSNWFPALQEPFSIALRLSNPKPEALTWTGCRQLLGRAEARPLQGGIPGTSGLSPTLLLAVYG